MSSEVIIALDVGTTGTRAIAFSKNCLQLETAYRELTQYFPEPGLVEQDAVEILDKSLAVLSEVASKLDASLGNAHKVAAIGITNQRETTVVWDSKTGHPYANAIVWQDRRTAKRCDELVRLGYLPTVRSITGLVCDPYFSATKLEWLLKRHQDNITQSTNSNLLFGTVDTWILWNLTGGKRGGIHATDVTNASRTMLYDINNLCWSKELLQLFNIPPSCLPTVRPSSGYFGSLSAPQVPSSLAGVPITAIAGDQHAALFGQACFHPGMAKTTYGTGSFVEMFLGEKLPMPKEGLLNTIAWQLENKPVCYCLEGSIFITGAGIQWLRDKLGFISQTDQMESLVKSVPDSKGVYFVPAFTGIGSPWWDPYARGVITGISKGTTRAHIARATLDAIIYSNQDVIQAMSAAADQPIEQLRVDGGASVMNLLLQLQADQLQLKVARPVQTETTALGVAQLAGLAAGIWNSLKELEELWKLDASFSPKISPLAAENNYQGWLKAVSRTRNWALPHQFQS
ncbi:MAG: glycerol kinase GlpK [Actinobacteria bacterium]|nr:glycerol kinase GlpK [Actinomycetota bacterium]MCL6105475.1 glycerol kinase GlpK [Actinomycetota bacterium]